MPAFTTKADGNWSATGQTTWNEVGKPGNGDTVTLSHNVTVDENTTIGSNPDDLTTAAIVMGVGKTLTIGSGFTLTVKGNVTKGGTLTLNAGSSFLFDKGATARAYQLNGGNIQTLRINGSSGSRCTFGAVSGSRGGSGYVGWSSAGTGFSCSYCDFVRMGNTSSYSTFYPSATAGEGNFDRCTFNECARISIDGASNQPATMTNCVVNGYTSDNSYSCDFAGCIRILIHYFLYCIHKV